MSPDSVDLITATIGFVFTLMILSYVIGDNPLFRVATHIFIGISAGYVALVLWEQVIYNRLIAPFIYGNDPIQKVLLVIPLVMGAFLLTKLSPRQQWLGRWVVAYIVGVGAAAAIAGAVMGTLIPQTWASMNLFNIAAPDNTTFLIKVVDGILILIGAIATLAYFQFTVQASQAQSGKRGQVMRVIAFVGEVFLAITFAVLFVGVFSAALTAFIDRVAALIDLFSTLSSFLFS